MIAKDPSIRTGRALGIMMLVLMVVGASLLLRTRAALANIITVNTKIDGLEGCTFRRAVENHNASGHMHTQCAAGSSTDTILIPDTVDLGKPLEITGGSLQIEGTNPYRCAAIRGFAYMTIKSTANVELLSVGMSANGSKAASMIQNYGKLKMGWGGRYRGLRTARALCTFTNFPTTDTSPTPLELHGGAINNLPGGSVVIEAAHFASNRAQAGGAIYNRANGTLTIVGTKDLTAFTSNFAETDGGAIYNSGHVIVSSSHFEFLNNRAGDRGGAIFNGRDTVAGTVEIVPSVSNPDQLNLFSGNFTSRGDGGAIFYEGSSSGAELRVDAVDFESNGNSTVNKVGRGGAIYLKEAPAHFRRTTFHGNRAVRGGAIFIDEPTPVRVIESTFYGNTWSEPANNSGIDVDGRGDLKIVNSTFFGVGGVDEVIHVESGKADIFFSTLQQAHLSVGLGGGSGGIFGTLLDRVNCVGKGGFEDRGSNLRHEGLGCAPTIPVSSLGLDPLGPWYNGGLTETFALEPNSRARDAIKYANCLDSEGKQVATDQRGFLRRSGTENTGCDIGAFEYNAIPPN